MPGLRRAVALNDCSFELPEGQLRPANPPLTSPNARSLYHPPTNVPNPSTDVIPTRYRRNTDVEFAPHFAENHRLTRAFTTRNTTRIRRPHTACLPPGPTLC